MTSTNWFFVDRSDTKRHSSTSARRSSLDTSIAALIIIAFLQSVYISRSGHCALAFYYTHIVGQCLAIVVFFFVRWWKSDALFRNNTAVHRKKKLHNTLANFHYSLNPACTQLALICRERCSNSIDLPDSRLCPRPCKNYKQLIRELMSLWLSSFRLVGPDLAVLFRRPPVKRPARQGPADRWKRTWPMCHGEP